LQPAARTRPRPSINPFPPISRYGQFRIFSARLWWQGRPRLLSGGALESAGHPGPPKASRNREPYSRMGVPAAMVFLAPPEVTRALETRFAEALEQARSLLRQPSVSATGEGIPECAEMVRQMMTDIGCKTRLWSKGGHPLVVGDLDVGAPVTLVEYE